MKLDQIPTSLMASKALVRRWWRPKAIQLLQGATWTEVFVNETWASIADVKRKFVLDRRLMASCPTGVPIYLISSELCEQAYEVLSDREEMYQQLKRVVLTGLDELWIAISLLKGVFYPSGTSWERDSTRLSAQVVQKQMQHWDWYCEHETIFYSPIDAGFVGNADNPLMRWHTWAGEVFADLRQLGLSQDQAMSLGVITASELGRVIRQVLYEYHNKT